MQTLWNGIFPMERGDGNEGSPKYQRMEEDETRSFRSSPSTNLHSEMLQSNTDIFFQAAHQEILTKPLSCKDSGGLVKSIET